MANGMNDGPQRWIGDWETGHWEERKHGEPKMTFDEAKLNNENRKPSVPTSKGFKPAIDPATGMPPAVQPANFPAPLQKAMEAGTKPSAAQQSADAWLGTLNAGMGGGYEATWIDRTRKQVQVRNTDLIAEPLTFEVGLHQGGATGIVPIINENKTPHGVNRPPGVPILAGVTAQVYDEIKANPDEGIEAKAERINVIGHTPTIGLANLITNAFESAHDEDKPVEKTFQTAVAGVRQRQYEQFATHVNPEAPLAAQWKHLSQVTVDVQGTGDFPDRRGKLAIQDVLAGVKTPGIDSPEEDTPDWQRSDNPQQEEFFGVVRDEGYIFNDKQDLQNTGNVVTSLNKEGVPVAALTEKMKTIFNKSYGIGGMTTQMYPVQWKEDKKSGDLVPEFVPATPNTEAQRIANQSPQITHSNIVRPAGDTSPVMLETIAMPRDLSGFKPGGAIRYAREGRVEYDEGHESRISVPLPKMNLQDLLGGKVKFDLPKLDKKIGAGSRNISMGTVQIGDAEPRELETSKGEEALYQSDKTYVQMPKWYGPNFDLSASQIDETYKPVTGAIVKKLKRKYGIPFRPSNEEGMELVAPMVGINTGRSRGGGAKFTTQDIALYHGDLDVATSEGAKSADFAEGIVGAMTNQQQSGLFNLWAGGQKGRSRLAAEAASAEVQRQLAKSTQDTAIPLDLDAVAEQYKKVDKKFIGGGRELAATILEQQYADKSGDTEVQAQNFAATGAGYTSEPLPLGRFSRKTIADSREDYVRARMDPNITGKKNVQTREQAEEGFDLRYRPANEGVAAGEYPEVTYHPQEGEEYFKGKTTRTRINAAETFSNELGYSHYTAMNYSYPEIAKEMGIDVGQAKPAQGAEAAGSLLNYIVGAGEVAAGRPADNTKQADTAQAEAIRAIPEEITGTKFNEQVASILGIDEKDQRTHFQFGAKGQPLLANPNAIIERGIHEDVEGESIGKVGRQYERMVREAANAEHFPSLLEHPDSQVNIATANLQSTLKDLSPGMIDRMRRKQSDAVIRAEVTVNPMLSPGEIALSKPQYMELAERHAAKSGETVEKEYKKLLGMKDLSAVLGRDPMISESDLSLIPVKAVSPEEMAARYGDDEKARNLYLEQFETKKTMEISADVPKQLLSDEDGDKMLAMMNLRYNSKGQIETFQYSSDTYSNSEKAKQRELSKAEGDVTLANKFSATPKGFENKDPVKKALAVVNQEKIRQEIRPYAERLNESLGMANKQSTVGQTYGVYTALQAAAIVQTGTGKTDTDIELAYTRTIDDRTEGKTRMASAISTANFGQTDSGLNWFGYSTDDLVDPKNDPRGTGAKVTNRILLPSENAKGKPEYNAFTSEGKTGIGVQTFFEKAAKDLTSPSASGDYLSTSKTLANMLGRDAEDIAALKEELPQVPVEKRGEYLEARIKEYYDPSTPGTRREKDLAMFGSQFGIATAGGAAIKDRAVGGSVDLLAQHLSSGNEGVKTKLLSQWDAAGVITQLKKKGEYIDDKDNLLSKEQLINALQYIDEGDPAHALITDMIGASGSPPEDTDLKESNSTNDLISKLIDDPKFEGENPSAPLKGWSDLSPKEQTRLAAYKPNEKELKRQKRVAKKEKGQYKKVKDQINTAKAELTTTPTTGEILTNIRNQPATPTANEVNTVQSAKNAQAKAQAKLVDDDFAQAIREEAEGNLDDENVTVKDKIEFWDLHDKLSGNKDGYVSTEEDVTRYEEIKSKLGVGETIPPPSGTPPAGTPPSGQTPTGGPPSGRIPLRGGGPRRPIGNPEMIVEKGYSLMSQYSQKAVDLTGRLSEKFGVTLGELAPTIAKALEEDKAGTLEKIGPQDVALLKKMPGVEASRSAAFGRLEDSIRAGDEDYINKLSPASISKVHVQTAGGIGLGLSTDYARQNPYVLAQMEQMQGSTQFKDLIQQMQDQGLDNPDAIGADFQEKITGLLSTPGSKTLFNQAAAIAGKVKDKNLLSPELAGVEQVHEATKALYPELVKEARSQTGSGQLIKLPDEQIAKLTALYKEQEETVTKLNKAKKDENQQDERKYEALRQNTALEIRKEQGKGDIAALQQTIGGYREEYLAGTLNQKGFREMRSAEGQLNTLQKEQTQQEFEEKQGKFGGMARKLFGGFGLMYLRSIGNLATSGLGYGQQERQEFEEQTAQQAAQAFGGGDVATNQQTQLKNQMALSGSNFSAKTAAQMAGAKNPWAREIGSSAIAGVSAWGLAQYLGDNGLPEIGKASGAIGVGIAAASIGFQAYEAAQAPDSLASRLGSERYSIVDDLAAFGTRLSDSQKYAKLETDTAYYGNVNKQISGGNISFQQMQQQYQPYGYDNTDIYRASVQGYMRAPGGDKYAEQSHAYAQSIFARSPGITQSVDIEQQLAGGFQLGIQYDKMAGQLLGGLGQGIASQYGQDESGKSLIDQLTVALSGTDESGKPLIGDAQNKQMTAGAQFLAQAPGIKYSAEAQGVLGSLTAKANTYETEMATFNQQKQDLQFRVENPTKTDDYNPLEARHITAQRVEEAKKQLDALEKDKPSLDIKEENLFYERADKLAEERQGQLYLAQSSAFMAAKGAGIDYAAPSVGGFFQEGTTDLVPMTDDQINLGMMQTQGMTQLANYNTQIASAPMNKAYQLGNQELGDQLAANVYNAPQSEKWKMSKLYNMDSQMLGYLGTQGLDYNAMPGISTIDGGSVSAAAFNQQDVGLSGNLTGLAYGRTSFAQAGGFDASTMAGNIFGQDWQSNAKLSQGAISAGIGGQKLLAPVTLPSGEVVSEVGGSMGMQIYQDDLQYTQQMAQIGIQKETQQLSYAFTTGVGLNQYNNTIDPTTGKAFGNLGATGGFWGQQDAQRQLGYQQQEFGFSFQQRQMDLGASQFKENFALNQTQSLMQRDFTQQDWQYQDQQRGQSWEWKQEDFQESRRFQTGRQRRLSERQMERESIVHDQEGGQIDKKREQQEEMWKLEDERWSVQLKQHSESLAMQQEQLTKQKEFFEERKKLEDSQQMLQRAYFIQQHELQKKSSDLAAQNAEENLKVRQTFTQMQIAAELSRGELNKLTEDGFMRLLEVLADMNPEIAKLLESLGFGTASSSIPKDERDDIVIPAPPKGGSVTTCFVPGTLVTMADGSLIEIENLQVGETVKSWDTEKKEYANANIVEVFTHEKDEFHGYYLFNGRVGVTGEHLLYVNGQWIAAEMAVIGDQFLAEDGGNETITSIKYVSTPLMTYNIHTDHETHNYFADGILAHNAKKNELAGGGNLFGSAEVNVVGEAGWEFNIGGQVVPHETSAALWQGGLRPGASAKEGQNKLDSYYQRMAQDKIAENAMTNGNLLASDSVSSTSVPQQQQQKQPATIILNVGNEELKRFFVSAIGDEF